MTSLKCFNILLFLLIFGIICSLLIYSNNFFAYGQLSYPNPKHEMIDKKLFYLHTSDQKNNDKSLLTYTFEPFLSVNGTDYIDIPHNKTLSLEEFAITFWFKTDQPEFLGSAHLVNKGGFNSDEEGKNMNYGVWISEEGNIHGGFESKSGEDFIVQSSTKNYNEGKWHFVLLSYDGTLLKLDIDGKEVDSKNIKGIPDTTGDQPLRIGANSLDIDKFFTGDIDEIRIFSKGLTEKEIQDIYEENVFNKDGQILYLNFGINKEDKKEEIIKETSNNDKLINQNLSDIDIKKKNNKTDSLLASNNVTANDIENKEEKESLTSSPITTNEDIIDEILSPSILENKTKENNYFNIVTAGDFGCSMRTQENIKNMESLDPELFLALGDYSYKKSPDCWFDMTKSLDKNIKIAIGN
ncbi:MAG: LamG domain-containing protein, partial [Nitrososphaeraceae archaeon]